MPSLYRRKYRHRAPAYARHYKIQRQPSAAT